MTDHRALVESFYEDPVNLINAVTDDVEWNTMPGIPYGGIHRGPEQVRANVLSRVAAEWEGFRSTADTILASGDDCVVVLGRYSGTFRATGRRLENCDFAHVFYFRDRRVAKLRQYVDSAVFNAVMS